jgi:predicted AAA+ superfamily ATPase
MQIYRLVQKKIEQKLFRGKVVIIYGARQVGKTTLIKAILENYSGTKAYHNCENLDIQQALQAGTATEIHNFFGNPNLLILDEAQKVKNIGSALKLLHDTYPDIQIIATGSSSFELANQTKEPLTGRKFEFFLPPVAVYDIENKIGSIETNRNLLQWLNFGMYPEIVTLPTPQEKITRLKELSSSYLYRDLFTYQQLRNPELITQLLQLLALQIGQEVSYNELATTLKVNEETIQKYIQLLEDAFVIFRLSPFSRNLRKEITKKRKIYFWDLGIRNGIIGSFSSPDLRPDIGHLWENFCIAERKKRNLYLDFYGQSYFWRTHDQQEIDYLEEKDQHFELFEFKWKKTNAKLPPAFEKVYGNHELRVINPSNLLTFTTLK